MSLNAPLVSVIVPNYRHAAFLPERLRSIADQTMRDLEIILLDDASDDGSADVLRAFVASDDRVTALIVNERNSGSPFSQWRRGLEQARGTWIWIAESDDSCTSDLLEHGLALDARAGGLGLVYCGSRIVDDQGADIGSMRVHTSDFPSDPFGHEMVCDGMEFVRRFLKVKNVVPNASAVLFRKDLVPATLDWPRMEGMRMCGDWLFWVHLAQHGRVGYSPAELNRFRKHQGVSRVHRSLERKRQRVAEEAIVRSALARLPDVDQRAEEQALYKAWAGLCPGRAMLSDEFDQVRLPGRSRLSFLYAILRARREIRRSRKPDTRTDRDA